MIKKVLHVFFLCLLWQMTFAQSAKTHWIDSIYHELNANEKIGQLFLIPVSGNTDQKTINEIESLIKSHEIGGLIFKDIKPAELARLANHFQSIASVPLLIALEGGINSILDSTMLYPEPIVLGAIQNDTLIYNLGATIGRQLRMLGVNVLFTESTRVLPAGIDASPDQGSLGQNKMEVARRSVTLMRGLHDNGILACAQYTPLQGITILEVRKELPLMDGRPDTLQNFPVSAMIAKGLRGIAPAAAEFPLFYKDPSMKKVPYSSETLSALYSGEWVKKNYNYQGLVFVDVSQIDALSDKAGEAELYAFKKGNDVLMNSKEIGPAIRKIKKLMRREDDYEGQVEVTVKKILSSKFDAGLWQGDIVNTDNLMAKFNSVDFQLLRQKLYENAITVIRNDGDVLPMRLLEDKKFAYIASYSSERNRGFYDYLKKYTNTSFNTIEDNQDESKLKKSLEGYDVVFVGVYPQTSSETIKRIDAIFESLKTKPQIVICDFGNAFIWSYAHKYNAFVTGYTDRDELLRAIPEVIFGALPANGKIPYSPSSRIRVGSGLRTNALDRLAYSIPEDVKMNSATLERIDSIAMEAIKMKATPGCQIIVARKGKVIYEKNFGNLTYEDSLPVTPETIYDLASVTKVSATLQTAMFLYEHGKLDLNKKVSYYLPELKKTNKKDITVMDMLTHQSGLVPFIPMYPQTMKDTTYLPLYYSKNKSEKYPLQVGEKLFAATTLKDSVWSWIIKSKLSDKPSRTPYSYKYSDLGFLILQRLSETILNQPIDDFLSQNLYEPLGAYTTGFNPLTRFPKQTIAPTEDDKIYRKSFVSGTVHDERAAMLGGVAGHAGLFSTANDLAKLGQMWLQEGKYGGIQYYKPETIRVFTAKKFRNSRRGIGWDKPIPSDPGTLTSFYASPSTYGHTGFTGTCIWVDPEFDLVYIFLSNRVYPDRNNKLSNANIRSRIQDVIYKSIFDYVEEEKAGYIASDYAINASISRP